jgi:ADP-ribose pyrophosphatase YjhB (NUDIX family)
MSYNLIRGLRAGKGGQIALGCSATVRHPKTGKILLVRHADDGSWAVPGGFMEPGESLSENCIREVFEETGVQVQHLELTGIYTNPHLLFEYPDGNRWQSVILHFLAQPIGGSLRTSEETTEVVYFPPDQISDLEMKSLFRQQLADSLAFDGTVFLRETYDL